MQNRSRKKKPTGKDFNQLARSIVDKVIGISTPKKKPPRPVKKQDAADVDRAESEGMAQPQGLPPKKRRPAKKADKDKDPAAVAIGRKGRLVGGHARAAKLTKEQLSESARKAAKSRWNAK